MSPEGAIYLIIWVAVILGLAWIVDWVLTEKAGLPAQPVKIIVWIIAALLVILLILRKVPMP